MKRVNMKKKQRKIIGTKQKVRVKSRKTVRIRISKIQINKI
jgi:hypothetical protein